MAHVACQNFRERILWVRPSNQAWFDMADTQFDEQQWYENFRVTRDTFQFILNEIEREITRRNTPMRQAISARRRLAIVLYHLSSTAEYRTIANLFGVSISFVCSCIKEVSTVIVRKMKTKFITTPKGEEVNEIMRIYKDKWQFPMWVGAIDGTHIPIIAPVVDHTEYVNRKGYHSIVMQAVVDSKYLFRDVVVGWPGSVHDARIFSNSGLYKKGNERTLFSSDVSETIQGCDIQPLLLGDPAYPLLPWLVKGYPENSNTSDVERHFNYMLSRARMTVENTFGRWKGRFQKFLKRVDMQVETLVNVVVASCILHNICELQANVFLEDWEPDVIPLGQPPAVAIVDAAATTDATDVRDALAQYFALEVPHARRGRAARV
ncbi:putative nuclease HARBI1 [Montipora capricornis]|uniref:putative nuclease HARBI1 n=1 Tax=Montipora capricornis TaxID=246305 RepID=UPI0035F11489